MSKKNAPAKIDPATTEAIAAAARGALGMAPPAAVEAAAEAVNAAKSSSAPGVLKRTSTYFIDPKAIDRREGWNPRFDFEGGERLAQSLAENGMLQPIRVKRKEGGRFELVDGDRRFTAVEDLMKQGRAERFLTEGLPAIIVDKNQDDITSLVQMFESNSGKSFLPMEEAIAFKRMKDAGMTLEDIEKKTGRSDNSIVGALALLDADETLQAAVVKGEVSGGLAKQIAVHARGDKAKQAEIVADVKAAGKDKVKRRAVLKKIDDARRSKAAKQGKVLKIKRLSDDALAEVGQKLAKVFIAKAKQAGVQKSETEEDITAWIAKDDALAAAFTFGALQALKVAAGMKINLDI